jgi:hypothetical protein
MQPAAMKPGQSAAARIYPARAATVPVFAFLSFHFMAFFSFRLRLFCRPHWLACLQPNSRLAPPQGNPGWPSCLRSPFRAGRQTKPSGGSREKNTMKTDKNSHTPSTSGTDTHPEQAIPDTKPHSIFEVTFVLAQRSSGRLRIEAATLQEAQAKAKETSMEDVDNWDIFEDDLAVESVELINGGQSHE